MTPIPFLALHAACCAIWLGFFATLLEVIEMTPVPRHEPEVMEAMGRRERERCG